jgi:hypothetical protein
LFLSPALAPILLKLSQNGPEDIPARYQIDYGRIDAENVTFLLNAMPKNGSRTGVIVKNRCSGVIKSLFCAILPERQRGNHLSHVPYWGTSGPCLVRLLNVRQLDDFHGAF